MKKSLILFSVFAAFAACNGGLGEKGRTLARIDGKPFTEKELEERLSLLPEAQLQAVLANPEERRRHFDDLLRARLYALAGEHSKIANHDSLERRLAVIDQRVITQYYFETYINLYGGQTPKELEKYYRADSSKFTGDSGKVLPFSEAVGRVADSLLVERANLDSFYQANRETYLDHAHCNASLIQTASLKDAKTVLDAIQKDISFADAAAKFSTYYNKKIGGNLGRIDKTTGSNDIGSMPLVDSLLFDPATRLKPGEISRPIPKGSNFIVVRMDSCRDDFLPPLASLRPRIAGDYIQAYKSERSKQAVADLKAKYKVQLVSPYKIPTEEDIKAYYEQNKDSYQTPETFELYDIETSSKDKLMARFKEVKDLNGFKALASKVTENALTKSQGGYLGAVKRDFCLPYGVGMLPDLFPQLDSVKEGKVSQPVQSPDTQKWHFFWLVKKDPAQTKSLDRVHALVKSDLETNRITHIGPNDTLATYGDGRLLREDDVLFLKEELPPQMRDRYTRESLVDFLITWQVVSDEAKSLGLPDDEHLIARRLQNNDAFWGQFYQGAVLSLSYEEDTTLLMKTFQEKKAVFVHDTAQADWHAYVHDIAAYLTLTQKDFDIEYNTNPERYSHDSTHASLAASVYDVFQNLKPEAYQRLEKKVLEKLKTRFQVRIEDPTLKEPSLEPTAATYKKAQDLHYDRKLEEALALYGKLRETFPDRAGLQDSVGFGMAQIYIEQERYPQALSEYRRISYLYPNSPNNYKAMFMVGFIYSEHMKNDSAAVQAFGKMLAKYPKTDLSDDADWMIRNIRSGGKLMPKLQDDSTSTAPKK